MVTATNDNMYEWLHVRMVTCTNDYVRMVSVTNGCRYEWLREQVVIGTNVIKESMGDHSSGERIIDLIHKEGR